MGPWLDHAGIVANWPNRQDSDGERAYRFEVLRAERRADSNGPWAFVRDWIDSDYPRADPAIAFNNNH